MNHIYNLSKNELQTSRISKNLDFKQIKFVRITNLMKFNYCFSLVNIFDILNRFYGLFRVKIYLLSYPFIII